MVLLLDNYDSFTYNLVDYLEQLKVPVHVHKNDTPLEQIINHPWKGILLSPGPGTPEVSGILNDIIRHYHEKLPLLGICLSHQAIGVVFGAHLRRAIKPMHGKVSNIRLRADYLFSRLPEHMEVVRYHSLILDRLPPCLEPIAFSAETEIMAVRHNTYNVRGLQFHPEAFKTDFGFDMLKNWVDHNGLAPC